MMARGAGLLVVVVLAAVLWCDSERVANGRRAGRRPAQGGNFRIVGVNKLLRRILHRVDILVKRSRDVGGVAGSEEAAIDDNRDHRFNGEEAINCVLICYSL